MAPSGMQRTQRLSLAIADLGLVALLGVALYVALEIEKNLRRRLWR